MARVSLSSQQREGRPCLSIHPLCLAAQEDPGGGRGQTNWQMEDEWPKTFMASLPSHLQVKATYFYHMTTIAFRLWRHQRAPVKSGVKNAREHEPVLQIYSYERGKSGAWWKRCFPFLKPVQFTGSSGCQAYMGWELRRHAMWQRWHGLNMTLWNRQCVCMTDSYCRRLNSLPSEGESGTKQIFLNLLSLSDDQISYKEQIICWLNGTQNFTLCFKPKLWALAARHNHKGPEMYYRGSYQHTKTSALQPVRLSGHLADNHAP